MEEHVSKLIKINLVKFQISYSNSMEYLQDGWKGMHTTKWKNLAFLYDSFKQSMFKEKNPDCKILGKPFQKQPIQNFKHFLNFSEMLQNFFRNTSEIFGKCFEIFFKHFCKILEALLKNLRSVLNLAISEISPQISQSILFS